MPAKPSARGVDELPRHGVRIAPDKAVARLTYIARGESPRAALEAAIDWRDVVTPVLLDEIALAPVDVRVRYDAEPAGKAYYLHTLAFYLLALFREPRAFPLMLDYFASDSDLAEELSGEAISGLLPAMLVRCYDGNGVRQLRLMVETSDYDPIFRYECLQAYHGLALAGHVDKAEVMAFAGELLDAVSTDARNDRWYAWLALASAELQAPELKARIEALFDRGLMRSEADASGSYIVDKAGIAEIYAERPQKFAAAILSDSFFENFVDRVCRWYWFQKPRESAHPDAAARTYDAIAHGLPYARATSKVGRNEPCPCGSGKKFKKCCMH